jgi:hypothetical protein
MFTDEGSLQRGAVTMNRRLDSLLLGSAVIFGGLVNRRVGAVDKRIEELSDEVVDIREETAARPDDPPPIPGMPLPTGYGLQVRGPVGESILVPVCLPPGFELDSMMLCPEFLPRRGPDEAERPVAPARIVEVDIEPTGDPATERMGGTVQYVFGGVGQGFTGRIAQRDEPTGSVPTASITPMRPGVESHQL